MKESKKKIVAVQFEKKHGEGYGGREYSYYAETPLEVGQIVKVSTKNGESRVKVCNADVDESTINPTIRAMLRTITSSCLLLDSDGQPLMDNQISIFGE